MGRIDRYQKWTKHGKARTILCLNCLPMNLTHWGRVTHICVSKLTIIGSDNGLRLTGAKPLYKPMLDYLLIGPSGTNFSEILIGILTFSFKKMCLKVSSAERRPFCVGLNVLMLHPLIRAMLYIRKITMALLLSNNRACQCYCSYIPQRDNQDHYYHYIPWTLS